MERLRNRNRQRRHIQGDAAHQASCSSICKHTILSPTSTATAADAPCSSTPQRATWQLGRQLLVQELRTAKPMELQMQPLAHLRTLWLHWKLALAQEVTDQQCPSFREYKVVVLAVEAFTRD